MIEGFERPIPPAIIAAGALLMAVSLGVVAAARVTGAGGDPAGQVAQSRDLRIEARPANGLEVQAMDGRVLRELPAGKDSFLRSVAEKLVAERAARTITGDPPYRLIRWADGRLSLLDPSTGRDIHLESFGSQNEADAATLMTAGKPA